MKDGDEDIRSNCMLVLSEVSMHRHMFDNCFNFRMSQIEHTVSAII